MLLVSVISYLGLLLSWCKRNPEELLPDELDRIYHFSKNKPSVVCITNLVARWDASTCAVVEVPGPQPAGSGFVWDEEGHIATNYHVIDGASKVRVTFADGTIYDAQVFGFDRDVDVAVLHVDAPKDNLRSIPVGISANLCVGQNVYVIGHPFGLDYSFTAGVISALRKDISLSTGLPIRDVVQTDADINPGNSGGPLLDSSGSLIGMVTYIISPSGASCGLGFAIAVDTVSGIVDHLVKVGKVAPDEQLADNGELVLDGPTNGPAGKAGLQPTKHDVDERRGKKVT